MAEAVVIAELDAVGADDLADVGGKAANLGELRRAGLPVPDGFVITTAAYRRARAAAQSEPDAELREAISRAYAGLGEGRAAVAVRSSATSEDLPDASFAGQQETLLNVVGADAVAAAVGRCWASLLGERAVTYRAQHGIDEGEVAIAVVVQTLVDADASGVMFTANPTTGDRNEILISAAWGLGESVVGGLVDTDELIVVDGRVRERRTATKQTMTVRTPEGTAQVDVPPERRSQPVLDDPTALALADLGRRSAEHFGRRQDLEWAVSGDQLFIVQSRPVTALPEPTGFVPTDWSVPDPDCWYFRASIVEQLPDPLSPLFASLIDSSVRRSLQALMGELIAPGIVHDHDVGLPTINGYAYYAYSRRGMLTITLQSPRTFPVLLGGNRRSGIRRWREISHPAYVAVVDTWRDRDLASLDDHEMLRGLSELLDAATTYYTAVQTIIPVAACSELIFSWFYRHLVARSGDPSATNLLLGGDSEPIRAEKSLWDLASWVKAEPTLTAWLKDHEAAAVLDQLRAGSPTSVPSAVWDTFGDRLRDHLERFGHTVYNLDFMNPVPIEDPTPMIDTVKLDLEGRGTDPYARQSRLQSAARAGAEAVRNRLGRWRRPAFDSLLGWARRSGPIREDALADVGLAWPRLRAIAYELGDRLTKRGVIDRPDEVFWLTYREIDADLRDTSPAGRTDAVAARRATWRGQRRAEPPQVLPRTRLTGMFDRWLPAVTQGDDATITGLAASAGKITATARVICEPSDFGRLKPGEVLVAAVTTPAWTTLFTRAGAVVTDVGGPLSHSSIVAREYGIPAVLGTGVATRRIPDGALVDVDGDAGTVRVIDESGDVTQDGGTGSGSPASPVPPSARR